MTRTTSLAAKLASIAVLALISTGCNDKHGQDLKVWLASTPIYPPSACPMAPDPTPPGPSPAVPKMPYFKFPPTAQKAIDRGTFLSCIEDGPYTWNDSPWYVQRLDFIDDGGQKRFATRVCSVDAVPDTEGPARDLTVETPGGPVQYVSPTKCQLIVSR